MSERFFNDSFFEEEIRCGFKVTTERKKLWAKEIEILAYFDKVCKENDINYMVGYGTLLGAVRHKGFIPWDDDIDVIMMRDEYSRLKEMATEIFEYPYSFQDSSNSSFIMNFAKIRDEKTCAIEFWESDDNQGIFIDIFPLDDVEDGESFSNAYTEIEKELWQCAYEPEVIKRKLNEGEKCLVDRDILELLLGASYVEIIEQYENFCLNHFGKSMCVNYLSDEMYVVPKQDRMYKKWFDEIIYLPFEHLMVPAPKDYDLVLRHSYGNWKEFKIGASAHEGKIYFDTEHSYKEVLSMKNTCT